jgi:hypothetical protein
MTSAQKSAVRYWELRRIVFILLIIGAGDLGWGLSNSFNAGIDDLPVSRYSELGSWGGAIMSFIALNALFSMGYVAEYFFEGRSRWPKSSRTLLFLGLTVFGCFHAIGIGGIMSDRLSLRKAIWPAEFHEKEGANQPPQGTPGTVLSSSTEPETGRP